MHRMLPRAVTTATRTFAQTPPTSWQRCSSSGGAWTSSLCHRHIIARSFFGGGFDGGRSDSQDDDQPKILQNGEAGSGDGAAPAVVGVGDDAPRPSPLIALPLLRRPLFPGLVQGLVLNDEATISAISDLQSSYVGLFLRKQAPLDDKPPEVISSLDDIYSVGTLAQVHNLVPSPASTQIFLTVGFG